MVMRCQCFHIGLNPGEAGMKQLSGQRSFREKCTVRHPRLCSYDEALNPNHFSQTLKYSRLNRQRSKMQEYLYSKRRKNNHHPDCCAAVHDVNIHTERITMSKLPAGLNPSDSHIVRILIQASAYDHVKH